MGERCSKKVSSVLNIALVLCCCLIKSPWNSWLSTNLSSHANNTNLSPHISVGHKSWLTGLVPLLLISQSQDQAVLLLSLYGGVLEIICSQAHSGCWPSFGSCSFMTYVSISSVKCQPGLSHCFWKLPVFLLKLSIWQPYSNEGSNPSHPQIFSTTLLPNLCNWLLCFPLLLLKTQVITLDPVS